MAIILLINPLFTLLVKHSTTEPIWPEPDPTSGLCSKCYRESLRKDDTAASTSSSAAAAKSEELGAAVAAAAGGSGSSSPQMAGEEAPKAVERCGNCPKRLKLLSRFVCRCGGEFCAAHRLPETHTCDFDFKTHGRAAIAEANPVVVASKLERLLRGAGK